MKMQAFKAALPHTLPIAVGFLFLGVSYGFLMRSLGFSFVYPMLMSLFIFAGSMEFVAAHLGWKKPYLIFGMCDESFTINCTVKPPADVDSGWFMFFVTLLNQIYWVAGATLGSLLGYIIKFDTTGIDFVMTALFVVMFLGQWDEAKEHRPALVGLGCACLCLLLFGGDSFVLPAMALIVLCFTFDRKRAEQTTKEAA